MWQHAFRSVGMAYTYASENSHATAINNRSSLLIGPFWEENHPRSGARCSTLTKLAFLEQNFYSVAGWCVFNGCGNMFPMRTEYPAALQSPQRAPCRAHKVHFGRGAQHPAQAAEVPKCEVFRGFWIRNRAYGFGWLP